MTFTNPEYMCITSNQPDTKSNPNSNTNHAPATKQVERSSEHST